MDLKTFKQVSLVLWVDDDPVFHEMVREILKVQGYLKVKTATDAANAMRIVETGLVQILFTDLVLPGIDGVQLIRSVRSYDLFSKLPIVVVSAAPTKASVISAAKLGVTDFIGKPVTGEMIDQKVEEILARTENASGKEEASCSPGGM